MLYATLQQFIDNNELSVEEQISLMKDKIELSYKMIIDDVNENLIQRLLDSGFDIKFILTGTDKSKKLYEKYSEDYYNYFI